MDSGIIVVIFVLVLFGLIPLSRTRVGKETMYGGKLTKTFGPIFTVKRLLMKEKLNVYQVEPRNSESKIVLETVSTAVLAFSSNSVTLSRESALELAKLLVLAAESESSSLES